MAEQVDKSLLKVAIIDSVRERRNDMARAFEGLAEVQIAYPGGGGSVRVWRITAAGEELKSIGPVDVILRHFGDLMVDSEVQTQVTVYYGGNGGEDPRCPADAEEKIWRPVNAGSGALTPKEACELLEYVKTGKVKKPTFLEKPSAIAMLSALSILCQGFLAVHAEKMNQGWGPAEITNSLLETGFPAYMESAESGVDTLFSVLQSKRQLVCSPNWWSDIFNGSQIEVEQVIAREWEVTDYQRCPEKFKKLVDAIYGNTPITIDLVNNAYPIIAAKLRDR